MPPVQWLTALTALAVIIICFIRLKLTPEKRLIRIPVILVMAHVLIFYIAVALKDFNIFVITYDFSEWSSLLRFHSLATYAIIEFYGFWRDKWSNQH